jgi:hypothetical protein
MFPVPKARPPVATPLLIANDDARLSSPSKQWMESHSGRSPLTLSRADISDICGMTMSIAASLEQR